MITEIDLFNNSVLFLNEHEEWVPCEIKGIEKSTVSRDLDTVTVIHKRGDDLDEDRICREVWE